MARTAKQITVDLSALMTSQYLKYLDLLARSFEKIYLPHAARERIHQQLLHLNLALNSDFHVLGFEGDHFIWQDVPKEAIQAEIERTERLLDFCKNHCEVAPLDPAILDLLDDEHLAHLHEQVSLSTLLVARQTQSVLYSDDRRLRAIARMLGVAGFWTQPLLRYWVEKAIMTEEDYFEQTIKLICAHYYFTAIDTNLLNYALRKHNLSVTPEVDEILRTLEGGGALRTPLCRS